MAAEPQLKFAPSGTAICQLRVVAADRRMNKETGEWEDGDTLWMDVTAFKQLAENTVESVAKGDLLVITGRLRTEEWESDGQRRSKVALIADTIAASLAFRTLPHAGAVHQTRAAQNYRAPVEQAYSGSEEPPF